MPSNINPNNIDGSYPVAGQDNNSQGFRDNFTNTKTNFQFAEDEINDLQSKAILKAALVGQTLDNNMNDALLYAARIQDFSATRAAITATSGSITLNYASGHYQTITTSDPISLTFQNFPAAGTYGLMRVQFDITDTAHTITIPAAVSLGITGIQGISPGTAGVSNTISFAVAGKYEFAFGTSDGGSTITIFDLNRALTNFTAADLTLDDITATGFVSAAGNITGGNLVSAGTASVTGNVTGGNITTGGIVSASGNVTGANIVVSASPAGSLFTPTVQATGNISGFLTPLAGTALAPALRLTSGQQLTTISAGSFEYDGDTITAAVDASQRALVDLEHFRVATGDISLTNALSAQAVFGSTFESVTLPAQTGYFLEALYIVGPGTGTNLNAVTMSTVFAVTSALTSLYYTADSTVGLASAVNDTKRKLVTAPTASIVTDAAAGGNESYITVMIKGVLRTNLATTLTPQIAFSGTPAASSLRTLTGSYVRLTVIGDLSPVYIGNWS